MYDLRYFFINRTAHFSKMYTNTIRLLCIVLYVYGKIRKKTMGLGGLDDFDLGEALLKKQETIQVFQHVSFFKSCKSQIDLYTVLHRIFVKNMPRKE